MATIENADQAEIEQRKITEYILNPQHSTGKHKARVFESTLGITKDETDFLYQALLEAVQKSDAVMTQEDEYGKRYQIDFNLSTSQGQAMIRSGWIIRADENFPRFVTCYVL